MHPIAQKLLEAHDEDKKRRWSHLESRMTQRDDSGNDIGTVEPEAIPDGSLGVEDYVDGKLAGNARSWSLLWRKYDPGALLSQIEHATRNCFFQSPPVGYPESVVREVVPELIRRLEASRTQIQALQDKIAEYAAQSSGVCDDTESLPEPESASQNPNAVEWPDVFDRDAEGGPNEHT